MRAMKATGVFKGLGQSAVPLGLCKVGTDASKGWLLCAGRPQTEVCDSYEGFLCRYESS